MHFALLLTMGLSALAQVIAVSLSQSDAAVHNVFTSDFQPEVSIRYVRNSGVCETTPGVQQISGYIDVGQNMSLWFWFFEARNAPETAPFTLWLNGGPGCSSMIGLFQENGPCHVNPDGKGTTLNPFSWNNISNMIYIDQPTGTGFSFGSETVNSTQAASPLVWKAFQILFESPEFSKFESREFVFATESYGGHYGPAFVTYFDKQNKLIQEGKLQGEEVTVSALLINNGWYDPLLQNKAYLDFATNAPGYGQLQSDQVLHDMNDAYFGKNGCKAQEEACYAAGRGNDSNAVCITADNFCVEKLFIPAVGDRDSDDLRQNSSALFPPEFYIDFLANTTVKHLIGATSNYSECADSPFILFERTGDDARSWLPALSALADSGLKILIWAGDADINCNWLGGHASARAMEWYGSQEFRATPLTNITMNGKPIASVQNVDNFSFARVFAAGHEVMAFQPEASLEIFSQIVRKEQLHSV